ncbi:MAG: SNF2-related protein [Solirubrobacteraceae bacterium]
MSQSVAVASPAEGGKRGELFGGALTDEVLDSSRSVLAAHRGVRQRGLQQFFTPPEAAAFIKQVIDPHGRFAVLDPTAGNGALLSPWRREQRFGIEIDPDQVRGGDYEAIRGDVQRAFPMLVKLGVRFGRVVANPPFGLTWTDGSGRPESSTVAAWRMSLALLEEHGVGAFICGRDRFRREILPREDAGGVFATVECGDLFEDVALPCLIAFFVGHEHRRSDSEGLAVEAKCATAELSERALRQEITDPLRKTSRYVGAFSPAGVGPVSQWKLVHRELERRRREAASERPTYDVELRSGDRLSIRPSPFVRQALAKSGRLKLLETLHNQPVGIFALNGLDWKMLGELEGECELSIAPAVREAVVSVAAAAEREVIPLYEVRPQMRLGYLTDLDSILCTTSDPERGFEAGRRYPLRTDSRINVTTGQKVTRNKDGEPVIRKYDEEAKVLVIRVADEEFTESSEDISYILEHFEVPNPGDIATRFPDEVERQRALLDRIAADGRAAGSDPSFDWKRFQREDLARALTKTKDGGGFILSWEQGGGKTLGAAGYAMGAVNNGARNRVLFIVPQDLIPQYRQDINDKLGIEVEHITSPAQARQVAMHLRAGGDGWYITHYEALSLLGVKNEPLPPRDIRATGADGGSVVLDSSEFCPACHASYNDGWQKESPLVCSAKHSDEITGRQRSCAYVHKRLRVKSAAHHLSGAFADGVICIDEGTLIKGDGSQRSKAIRGLRARNRLLATGTPISNYVNQIFWLMWWCLGDSSLRFPYSYNGGLAAFEADFCVIEYTYGRQGSETAHRREKRKVLPQITNVSRFWRLSAAAMIRRRKRDFGEPIVDCTLKTVRAPMGVCQQKLYEHWLSKSRFASFFSWKYPRHPLVQSGQIERFAAASGS